MILNSPYITGSITVTGNTTIQGSLIVTGSLSGTASLASNSNLLQGTGSVGFATTASLLAVSSSQQQISASLLNVIATGATTGSNSFRANQSITGSLVVSSTITAQTLVVQTVTSSIVYSSGSNLFGSALGDRQTFTGSVNITGSQTVFGNVGINGGDFRYRPNGDVTNSPALVFKDAGNSALDICAEVIGDANAASRPITFRVSSVAGGRYEVMRITSAGYVGMGTTSPQASLHIAGKADTTALIIGASNGYEIFITGSDSANIYHASPNQAIYLNTNGGPLHLGTSAASTLLTITGSSVGIGNTSPDYKLDINSTSTYKTLMLRANAIGSRFDTALEFNAVNVRTGPYARIGLQISSATSGDETGGLTFWTIANGSFSEKMAITSGGNVGIGTTNPSQPLTVYKAGASNYLRVQGDNSADYDIAQQFTDGTNNVYSGMMRGSTGITGSYTIWTGGNPRLNVTSGGNVGIGTTSPTAVLQVRGPNATGIFFDAQNAGAGGAVFSRINASSSPYNQYLFNNGYVGIGRTPLAQLAVLGGAVQIMGDYPNWQTIIKSAGANGTFSGQLTITIPQMSDGNVDGYGGYSCEVYVAGYDAWYCHAWFSGYINGGITSSEATILRSNGGWSISQASFGANNQGFQFVVNYPTPYIVHPTARIIFNKGGSPNSAEYPANSITAVFS